MNQIGKMLLVITAAGFGFNLHAITPNNRYDTIIDRNIFRLNEPPVVTTTPQATPELDKNIEFSGISIVGGEKKAWFVVKPAKAGPKDVPQYMSLGVGERQEFLEVVNILEAEGEVKILNSGNSMVLSLKNNSPKAMPAAPITPGVPAPTPVANVPQPQPAAPAAYAANMPTYGGATATVTGGPGVSAATAQTADSGGLRSIPTRTLRLAPVPTQPVTPQTTERVDPVMQRFMMEAQQEHAKQTGQVLPPLPPLP